MSRYLFDASSTRNRNRRVVWTIIGSLLFHGALVGGAALFSRPPQLPGPQTTTFFPTPDDSGYLPPSSPEPSLSTPELDRLPTPVTTVPDIPTDTPPLVEDLDIVEPTPATPTPVVRPPVAQTRPRSFPVPSMRANGDTSPGSGQKASVGTRSVGVRWSISSKPMYPPTLRAMKIQGSGMVRITTDAAGRVVGAVIVQSTGNAVLDANTCQHARASWNGPASTSTNVPFTYRLQ